MYKYTLELSSEIENMEKVMAFIEEHTDNLGSPRVSKQLMLAGEELALNIFNYAYGETSGTITMSISHDPERRYVVMEFRDKGKPFNPLENEDPDVKLPIAERKTGGLGIMFSKRVTDKQAYAYDNGHNVLTVEKAY